MPTPAMCSRSRSPARRRASSGPAPRPGATRRRGRGHVPRRGLCPAPGAWADEGRAAPELLDRKSRLLALVGGSRGQSQLAVGRLAAEIEWAKARLRPDGYAEAVAARAGARRRPQRMAELYRRYEEAKRKRGWSTSTTCCGVRHLIEADPAFAAAQRWRFRHLFVDEFQDVNPLQFRLLEAWRGDRYDLCVVGDPQQAIYGWNGADAGFLEGFRRRYPPADVIELLGSYRSTPSILAAAGDVLRAAGTGGREVHARRPDGVPPRLSAMPTIATRPGPSPGRCATGGARGRRGRPRRCSYGPTHRFRCSPRPSVTPGSPTGFGAPTPYWSTGRCATPWTCCDVPTLRSATAYPTWRRWRIR